MKCQVRGCIEVATEHYCSQDVCQHCLIEKKIVKSLSNKKMRIKYKEIALEKAQEYFDNHFEDIKSLSMKNKKKILKKIVEFYKDHTLSEPMFAILIMDIINQLGGDAVLQFPFPNDNRLNGQKADVYCRKYKIAVETKASFFYSQAQLCLPTQIREYKKAFGKKALVLSCSPDSVQKQTVDLFTLIQLLSRVIR